MTGTDRFADANAKARRSQRRNMVVLSFCVLALVVLCYQSVQAPIRFEREQAVREQAVKRQLTQIRQAQEAYRQATGRYCASIDTLIVRHYLADSLRTIPGSNGKPWRLKVASQPGASGEQRSSVECGATYDDYLEGLDRESIDNLKAAAQTADRYPGLRFGDATKAGCTDCNW